MANVVGIGVDAGTGGGGLGADAGVDAGTDSRSRSRSRSGAVRPREHGSGFVSELPEYFGVEALDTSDVVPDVDTWVRRSVVERLALPAWHTSSTVGRRIPSTRSTTTSATAATAATASASSSSVATVATAATATGTETGEQAAAWLEVLA